MFFLWMVTLEDVGREAESSIEMRRFGGQRSEKFSIEVWVETHTKPIRAPKMRQQEHTTRDTRARAENARSRCNATAPGANTKQRATGENSLGRIGKDEVPSSNLGSSSTQTRCPARDSGFLLFLPVNHELKKAQPKAQQY